MSNDGFPQRGTFPVGNIDAGRIRKQQMPIYVLHEDGNRGMTLMVPMDEIPALMEAMEYRMKGWNPND